MRTRGRTEKGRNQILGGPLLRRGLLKEMGSQDQKSNCELSRRGPTSQNMRTGLNPEALAEAHLKRNRELLRQNSRTVPRQPPAPVGQFAARISNMKLRSTIEYNASQSQALVLQVLQNSGVPKQALRIASPTVLLIEDIPQHIGDFVIRSNLKKIENVIVRFETVLSIVDLMPADHVTGNIRAISAAAETLSYSNPRVGDIVVASGVRFGNETRVLRLDLLKKNVAEASRPIAPMHHGNTRINSSPSAPRIPLRADDLEKQILSSSHATAAQKNTNPSEFELKQTQEPQEHREQRGQGFHPARSRIIGVNASNKPTKRETELENRKVLLQKLAKLSQSIHAFFEEHAEDKKAQDARHSTFQNLERVIKSVYPSCELVLFGSCAVGLSSKKSDIDVCINFSDQKDIESLVKEHSEKDYKKNVLKAVGDRLQENGFEDIVQLLEIRIPIVKCKETVTQIEADISFTDASVHHAKTNCLKKFLVHPIVRELIHAVKHWSGIRKIRNSWMLNSYAWTLMSIQFFQVCLPTVFQCPKDNEMHGKINELQKKNISEVFLRFVQFYHSFDWENLSVCVREGRPLNKTIRSRRTKEDKSIQQEQFPTLESALENLSMNQSHGQTSSDDRILGELGFQEGQMTNACIEDPVDPTDNVGRNLRTYERIQIQMEFARANDILTRPKLCNWELLCEKPRWIILQFLVPGSRMGAVIGSKGANVEKIKLTTGIRVSASPKENGVKWRYLRLDGIPERVARALSLIVGKAAQGRPPSINVLVPGLHISGLLEKCGKALRSNLIRLHVKDQLPTNMSKGVSRENHLLSMAGTHTHLVHALRIIIEGLLDVGGGSEGHYVLPRVKKDSKKETEHPEQLTPHTHLDGDNGASEATIPNGE